MGMWRGAFLALVCSASACGGSEFEADPPIDSGTGGTSGSGGSSATGGSGGTAGTAGTPSGGGTAGAGNVGGTAGSGGGAGAPGPGPITIVNATDLGSNVTDDVPTLALGFTPTPGNAIIVGISCHSTADSVHPGDCVIPPGGVTDNQGNTYERIVQGQPILSSAQGARSYIFIAENIGAPSSEVVLSVDPVGIVPPEMQLVAWGAIEVSGLATAPSLDAWAISLVGGDQATSTQAITDLAIQQPNELAIGVLTMRSDDTNMLITAEGGWTTHQANQNGTDYNPPGHSMVSLVTTQVGQVSHTWTHDPPTRGVAAVIATFRGALTN